MRLSAIRCSRKRIVHEWAMASKKPWMSASSTQTLIEWFKNQIFKYSIYAPGRVVGWITALISTSALPELLR